MVTQNAVDFPSPLPVSKGGTGLTANPIATLFTPTITGSGSNPTVSYTTQKGYYIQIGNVVFWTIIIQLASISGGTGNLQISLPSTSVNNTGQVNQGVGLISNGTAVLRTVTFQSAGTNFTEVLCV